MTGNRSAYQYVILLSEDLHDLQALRLHTVTAHTAGHANALHYTAGIGGVTQRTRRTLTVMLTVRLFAYTMESMTLNNTLKTFTLRSANHFYFFAFGKDVHGDGFTKILFYGIIAEFFYKLFRSGACLGVVIFFCSCSVLVFLVAKC